MSLIDSLLQNTVPLLATVSTVATAIDQGELLPVGYYQHATVVFKPRRDLGSIEWTEYDRETTVATVAYTARYSSATTIQNMILGVHPRSAIAITCPILPQFPITRPSSGSVIPA